MAALVRIDDDVVDMEGFIRLLKLNGQFEGLLEQLVRDRLMVLAARKQGIALSPDEIQERADQYRRVRGLHRAADMYQYLDALGVSLDQFEAFIADSLYQEKVLEQVCSDRAVEEYFQLNAPRFDSMEVSHILVDSEGAAREMMSILADDPDSFPELAREHSLADTRDQGGTIGKVLRGGLRSDVEAKVFNAAPGDLLGPFSWSVPRPSPAGDRGDWYEIFLVKARHPARLDEETATEVRRLLREEWLMARAQEHLIEAG